MFFGQTPPGATNLGSGVLSSRDTPEADAANQKSLYFAMRIAEESIKAQARREGRPVLDIFTGKKGYPDFSVPLDAMVPGSVTFNSVADALRAGRLTPGGRDLRNGTLLTPPMVTRLETAFEKILKTKIKLAKFHAPWVIKEKSLPGAMDAALLGAGYSLPTLVPRPAGIYDFQHVFAGASMMETRLNGRKNLTYGELRADKRGGAHALAHQLHMAVNRRYRDGRRRPARLRSFDIGGWERLMVYGNQGALPGGFPETFSRSMLGVAYRWLNNDVSQLNIVLPCAGWGGRLVGIAAWAAQHPQVQVYVASCDVNRDLVEGTYPRIFSFLRQKYGIPNLQCKHVAGGAEHASTWEQMTADMPPGAHVMMSSPPYGIDTELYPGGDAQGECRQSHAAYETYESWCENFLQPTIAHSVAFLRASERSIAFWNVASGAARLGRNLVNDSSERWRATGIQPLGLLGLTTVPMAGEQKTRDGSRTVEPVFVYGCGADNFVSVARSFQVPAPTTEHTPAAQAPRSQETGGSEEAFFLNASMPLENADLDERAAAEAATGLRLAAQDGVVPPLPQQALPTQPRHEQVAEPPQGHVEPIKIRVSRDRIQLVGQKRHLAGIA